MNFYSRLLQKTRLIIQEVAGYYIVYVSVLIHYISYPADTLKSGGNCQNGVGDAEHAFAREFVKEVSTKYGEP